MSFRSRARRALLAVAASALLLPALAACQPAAPAPTATTAPAKPAATTAPAASPAVASPAAKPATSPVASPAASPAAKPAASPAAGPSPIPYPRPQKANPQGNDLGSAANPVKMAFVPSQDAAKVINSGERIAQLLNDATGLTFKVSVPTSYTAVIEAMGAQQVDVGWLAPFAYVLAKDKNAAEVALASLRQGSKTYRSQIIVHADSGITTLEQLRGKKFAFVDAASASGFLFPNALLASKGIDYKTFFSETVLAGGHPQVVIAVYNKQVDAGATFGDSREGGPPTDARTTTVSTLPDVLTKVKPIATTDPIPNDTVSVRPGLSADLKKLVTDGLLYVQGTPEGAQQLRALYNIDGLATASDADYNPIRNAARALNLNLEEQIAPPKPKT